MQVKPQPLCGSSAHLPLLEGNPVEGPSQHQGVLQKHRAERSYKSHNVTAPPQRQRGSLSPSENAYAQQCVTTGTYYTGNVHAQHIGLAGFVVERSEKQIRCELGRLYKLLQRSEKYQAYREKQPALTPAEVITRDAAERKEQERRKAEGLQQEKDKTVWPDFIEHAFWTGKMTLLLYLVLTWGCCIAYNDRCPLIVLFEPCFDTRIRGLTSILQHS